MRRHKVDLPCGTGDFLNAPPFEFGGNADTIAQVSIANISSGQVGIKPCCNLLSVFPVPTLCIRTTSIIDSKTMCASTRYHLRTHRVLHHTGLSMIRWTGTVAGTLTPSANPRNMAAWSVFLTVLVAFVFVDINVTGCCLIFACCCLSHHQHYHDQTDLWANGELKPMRFSREAVESSVRTRRMMYPRQARM